MAKSPMVEARVPQDWQQQIQAKVASRTAFGIANASGRKEAEAVRSAIAQYLGKTDPAVVRRSIAYLQDRVVSLERKLAGLGRLVG